MVEGEVLLGFPIESSKELSLIGESFRETSNTLESYNYLCIYIYETTNLYIYIYTVYSTYHISYVYFIHSANTGMLQKLLLSKCGEQYHQCWDKNCQPQLVQPPDQQDFIDH